MQSRLGEFGLQSLDVGAGAGDCFFRSVSHQLYRAIATIICVYVLVLKRPPAFTKFSGK